MADKQNSPIRFRAFLTGLIFSIGICLLTPYNNIYQQATPLGGGHFPLAPFFIFLILAIIFSLISKLFKSRPFLSGGELLVVWIQMVIGSGIAYTGFARTFLINVTAPFHFATIENQWQETLQPLLPEMLIPGNKEAIELLYTGLPTGREMTWTEVAGAIPWQPWISPFLFWGLFILLSYTLMLCIINNISRQWIHNERMNFPLLRVPQEISKAVNEGTMGKLFSNRFLLIGLMIPVCLHLLNGLSFYFPSVPQIPTLILAGSYFPSTGLFSGFLKLKLFIYPAFIGFAFLTSRQISFSFWFFFLAAGFFHGFLNMAGYVIPASELGITFGPTLAHPEETQMIGAYGVFFLFLVWLARHHLIEISAESLFLKKQKSGRTEWFDVRFSVWGSFICYIALICWCCLMGMTVISATVTITAFFSIMIVATRIICQGGLAYFTLTAAPMDGLISLFGAKIFTGTSALIAGISQKVMFVDLRESLMPSLLHGRRVHHGNRPALLLFSGLCITIIASVGASLLAMMTLCYRFGMRELQLEWSTRTTLTVYENIYRLATTPVEAGSWVTIFTIIGALVMLVLVFCYHRIYWWPIHPLGYLTAYSSAMRILWLSFFIGWLCNVICMRYGGITMFKKLQFFFIGLIIGDLLMGGGWAIVGLFTDISYQLLPD